MQRMWLLSKLSLFKTQPCAEILGSVQEARSFQIRFQFLKKMPGWLPAKLMEETDNFSVEDFKNFALKQLSIHKFFETDDSFKDAFSERGPSVADTFVTTQTKASTSHKARENRLNELPENFNERENTPTKQLNDFQKNQTH